MMEITALGWSAAEMSDGRRGYDSEGQSAGSSVSVLCAGLLFSVSEEENWMLG